MILVCVVWGEKHSTDSLGLNGFLCCCYYGSMPQPSFGYRAGVHACRRV